MSKREPVKPDPTTLLLKAIKKTNNKGMGAVLPVRVFVELSGLGYVSGSHSNVQLATAGLKYITEDTK